MTRRINVPLLLALTSAITGGAVLDEPKRGPDPEPEPTDPKTESVHAWYKRRERERKLRRRR